MSKNWWTFISENILALVTVAAGVGVLIWQKITAPASVNPMLAMTLGLICLLATSEIVEGRKRLAKIQDTLDSGLSKLLAAVPPAQIRRFQNSESAQVYIASRLRTATVDVDQASIDVASRSRSEQSRALVNAARTELVQTGKVRHRYVFTYNDERAEHVRKWLPKATVGKLFLAVLPTGTKKLPLPIFMIIDGEEVFVRSPYEVGENEIYLSIKDPAVVAQYSQWFDRLWAEAEKIDPRKTIPGQLAELERLARWAG